MTRLMFPAIAAAALFLASPTRGLAQANFPHLHRAVFEMEKACEELETARHNFGGHKEAAIRDLRKAVLETKEALKHAGFPYKGFAAPRYEFPNHPHLREALPEEKHALIDLEHSGNVFGPFRQRAMHALEDAIRQTERCILEIRP